MGDAELEKAIEVGGGELAPSGAKKILEFRAKKPTHQQKSTYHFCHKGQIGLKSTYLPRYMTSPTFFLAPARLSVLLQGSMGSETKLHIREYVGSR